MPRSRSFAVLFALTVGCTALAAAQNAARTPVPRTPHRTLGKEDCLSCHAIGANEHVSDAPANHANRPNTMCARCHRPDSTLPSRSQHAFDAAHTRCAVCHVAGNTVNAQPTPANHGRYHASTCIACHEPQTGPGG